MRDHAGMRRAVSAQLQSDHKLTVKRVRGAATALARAGQPHAPGGNLADSLQLTPPGVTRLLDGLRERGFVDKAACPGDARVTYAVLADAGQEKPKEASCSHMAVKTLLRSAIARPRSRR